MVMGRRWVYSKKAVAPCSWYRQALVVLVVILSFLASSEGCQVDHCWEQAVKTMKAHNITEGSSRGYCNVLQTQRECIRAMARRCRGNLKYHTMQSLVMQHYGKYNCIAMPTVPTVIDGFRPTPFSKVVDTTTTTARAKTDYVQCAMFGDPHLRTFHGDYQTCKVVGAWPLVDNAYLAVQVTNDAVLPGTSNATALKKVTVLIKGGNGYCNRSKTYQAQVGNLPPAFVDGTNHGGPEKAVRVKLREADRHVEILIKYVDTVIVVRQVGNFLTVAIRMPRDVMYQGVAGDGLQLCMGGCPASERIDYVSFLWRDARVTQTQFGPVEVFGRDAALVKCRAANLTDFYLDSCVFDLMMTGEETFGQAAVKALYDLRFLTQNLYQELPNRTELPTLPPPVDTLGPGPEPTDVGALGRTAAALRPLPSVVVALCLTALLIGRPFRPRPSG